MKKDKLELSVMAEYRDWIKNIKQHIAQSQIKASIRVNQELLELYWYIGSCIIDKEKDSKWG